MQGATMDLGWIAREYGILIRYDKAHHCGVLVRPIDDSHVLALHPYRESRLIIRVLQMSANVGFCCGSGMVAPSLDNALASFMRMNEPLKYSWVRARIGRKTSKRLVF